MARVRPDLPSGTVTFLFTDVEGSTRLLHQLGAADYAQALADHRRILRHCFVTHGGTEVDTQGDAFFVAFPTAPGALAAASEALEALEPGPIRVRMGLHTGTPHLAEEGYVGADVNRAARIAAAGHGGQVLVSAATASLLDSDRLRDLGEHRPKDLSAPERIYQLGPDDFPPLKSLHQTNLPVPATPFLGREQEVAELGALLARDDVRLVTLTGTGGSGKTRLALQAAGMAADAFPGGVWWVPLATIRDPALVLEAAASAMGATGDLAEHIDDKCLLLVLDNFEQVVEAAAKLAELRGRCPGLSVLVTSREPLRIEGEWEYAVDPLREAEAVELFETRARAARRDFATDDDVRRICARLDNLPLAIELAAARVKVLSPRALLERMERRLPVLTGGTRDAPERQRTLQATIAWSHELLSREEQTLFHRLGVFAGGATLDSAEAVCDADLDALASLVDKSLVRQSDDRFWMLETIREYAVERLEAGGEADDLGRLHAEYFLALAEEAEPHLRDWWTASAAEWLDRLEGEHDNLRAALDRLEASGENELALRLAGAVSEFWDLRGHLVEGRRRLASTLAADERPTGARAKALSAAAALAVACGDAATGRLRAEEALALHRALGEEWGTANSVFVLGYALAEEGDMTKAQQLFDEAARRFDELGDEHYTLLARRSLAWAHEGLGDLEGARALHEDNLPRARALRNEFIVASTLGALATTAIDEGRVRDAVPMLEESHRLYRELGDPLDTAVNLCRFARALACEGKAGPAAQLVSSYEALCEQIGANVQWAAEMNEGTLATVRTELDEAEVDGAWGQGQTLTADEAVRLALDCLE
ncbi:MAG: hypothetical protein H0U03_13885 [Actinobacteria bacterium]|nr:hypothetical protein [Actinomycetota bacterium]